MDPNFTEQREEFRENLTLGLIPALENLPGIQDVILADHQPCDNIAITSWEQRYSTVLPHEIKDFYLATDGFRLTWSFSHAGDVLPIGHMVINRIGDLRRVAGLRHRFDTEQPTLLDLELVNNRDRPSSTSSTGGSGSRSTVDSTATQETDANALSHSNLRNANGVITGKRTIPQKPQFGLRWKMFELDGCEGNGRVCLVFPPKPDPPPVAENGGIQLDISPPTPQVWYLDRAYDWHYLAPNFTAYFRMMLVHLGLPQWHLLLTPIGPTPWAKQIINLVAPHLLIDHLEESGTYAMNDGSNVIRRVLDHGTDTIDDFPTTALDPAVFKSSRSRVRKGGPDDA